MGTQVRKSEPGYRAIFSRTVRSTAIQHARRKGAATNSGRRAGPTPRLHKSSWLAAKRRTLMLSTFLNPARKNDPFAARKRKHRMAAAHELVWSLDRCHMVSTMTPDRLISDERHRHQQKQKTRNPRDTPHASRYFVDRTHKPLKRNSTVHL